MLNELPGSVFVKILGIMQDGGLPHTGCRCARCSQAYDDTCKADYALVDATFCGGDELGGHISVAHPLIPQMIDLFSNLDTRIVLTHINHTNPVLDIGSPERESVLMAGVEIVETGRIYIL